MRISVCRLDVPWMIAVNLAVGVGILGFCMDLRPNSRVNYRRLNDGTDPDSTPPSAQPSSKSRRSMASLYQSGLSGDGFTDDLAMNMSQNGLLDPARDPSMYLLGQTPGLTPRARFVDPSEPDDDIGLPNPPSYTNLEDLKALESRLLNEVEISETEQRISHLRARLEQSAKVKDVAKQVPAVSSATTETFKTPKPVKPKVDVRAVAAQAAVVDLNALRRLNVAAQAEQTLERLDPFSVGRTESESHSDGSGDTDCSAQSVSSSNRLGKRHKKLKSGRAAKQVDLVKRVLEWPHTYLKYAHGTKDLKFDALDLPLLVAGELEIACRSNASSSDKKARACLLQALMYHSKLYTWSNCLDYFGAVLNYIEQGGTWQDFNVFAEMQNNTLLTKKSSRMPGSSGGTSPSAYVPAASSAAAFRPWFCRDFQSGECTLSDGHDQLIRGKTVKVYHICSYCSLFRKSTQKHPENQCNFKSASSLSPSPSKPRDSGAD